MKLRAVLLILPLLLSVAGGQEPLFSEAATHPGSGTFYSRFFFTGPTIRESEGDGKLELKSAYGFSSRLAVLPQLSIGEDGLADAGLRLKQQILRLDTGPINTWRASLQAGAEWRDGQGWGPRAGVVSTTIHGRHGFNALIDYAESSSSDPGRFEATVSYLYRLSPVRYRADTTESWYVVVESINKFSSSGTRVSDAAIGILQEARRTAFEFGLRFDDPESEISRSILRIGAGYRVLW